MEKCLLCVAVGQEQERYVAMCNVCGECVNGEIVDCFEMSSNDLIKREDVIPLDGIIPVGSIVVLDVERAFNKDYRKREYQLLRVEHGYGLNPESISNAVYGTILYDGDYVKTRRSYILGYYKGN